MSAYQQWVIDDYMGSRSRPFMTLDDYVESVIKNMPQTNDDEIYEPIEVYINLSGKYGSTPLQIDYSAGWYDRLRDAVGIMIGHKLSDISLRDVRNLDIGSPGVIEEAEDLERIGPLRVKVRDRHVDLPKIPAVPRHVANDSFEHLVQWYEDDLEPTLVDAISNELQGSSSMMHLQERTTQQSPLANEIKTIVTMKSGGNMKSFLHDYGSNIRAKTTDPEHVLHNISTTVLRKLRHGIQGIRPTIEKHFSAKTHDAVRDLGDDEDDIVLVKIDSKHRQDEDMMYSSLAKKVLSAYKMDILYNVYRASPDVTIGCKSKNKEDNEDDDEENDYYRDFAYGQDVYDTYQKYTGAPVFMSVQKTAPPSTKSEKMFPNDRGARLRKKVHQQNVQRTFEPFARTPVSSEMPSLRRIQKPERTPEDYHQVSSEIPPNYLEPSFVIEEAPQRSAAIAVPLEKVGGKIRRNFYSACNDN